MPDRLSRPPVFYVLTQAQFSPVKDIAHYIAKIQDALRLKGYPEFQEEVVYRLQPSTQGPQIENVKQWQIYSRDRKSGFIINDSSITFHSTSYATHSEFLPEIMKGLKIVQKVVKLDAINRLGLRYLNLILPDDGERLGSYLDPKLINVEFDGAHLYTKTETFVRTKLCNVDQTANLIFRAHILHGKPAIPVDIRLGPLIPRSEFGPNSKTYECYGITDTDHFVQVPMTLNAGAIEKSLHELYLKCHECFLKTTTSEARQKWK